MVPDLPIYLSFFCAIHMPLLIHIFVKPLPSVQHFSYRLSYWQKKPWQASLPGIFGMAPLKHVLKRYD